MKENNKKKRNRVPENSDNRTAKGRYRLCFVESWADEGNLRKGKRKRSYLAPTSY
jgi:hypothetical protein